MPISIATMLKDGSVVYCVVSGTEVISTHSTIKEAIDARRTLELPLPKGEQRATRETVTRAPQHHASQ